MKTWIGTSGFQYAEWKGTFYPEDLPATKMLPYFAERFPTTEINYTFHRIPAPKTIENWKAQTPERFRFALKAPQKITHFAKLRDCHDTLAYFCRVVSDLGDRLGLPEQDEVVGVYPPHILDVLDDPGPLVSGYQLVVTPQ